MSDIESTLKAMLASLGKPKRFKAPKATAPATAQAHSATARAFPRPSGPELPACANRYVPESLVFYTHEIRCNCGEVYTIPACSRPLVRMRNKYTGTIVETDKNLPTENLPLDHKVLPPRFVVTCQKCIDGYKPEYQGDLFLSADSVAALNVLMTIKGDLK